MVVLLKDNSELHTRSGGRGRHTVNWDRFYIATKFYIRSKFKNISLPSRKEPFLFFCPSCAMFWNKLKINFRILQFLFFMSCDRFCSQFSSYLPTKNGKMRHVLRRIFEFLGFFVRFLVFEIWSILYSTVNDLCFFYVLCFFNSFMSMGRTLAT